jgi:2,4-dienoyl-CoA reductase-like NADH-dependent reductase (Old Yellow Enzyme family)
MSSNDLLNYHRSVAEGGIGMTTVAYAAVDQSGLSFPHQLWLRNEAIPDLKKLTDAVHKAGAACSIQIGHCGNMTKRSLTGNRPMAPSSRINLYGPSFPRAMDKSEIQRVVKAFGKAIYLARMVAIARALIKDPDFVNKLRQQKSFRSECDICNYCIAVMYTKMATCILNEENPDPRIKKMLE